MTPAAIVASLSGALFPILFYQAGIDPAVASGPLDLVAVVVYYGLAWLILLNLLKLG